jgi:hypothetical protein
MVFGAEEVRALKGRLAAAGVGRSDFFVVSC